MHTRTVIVSRFFCMLGLSLLLFAGQLYSQQCEWKFVSGVECGLEVQMKLACIFSNPPIISHKQYAAPGTWQNPKSSLMELPNAFCEERAINCRITVIINGVEYKKGDIVCCGITSSECKENWCGVLNIDPTSRVVTLLKPPGCN